ncbi:MAG: PEP-CTERM sorting domain-containing protein [Microcoleus sp. PH2017_10_PVI_O_A]|uniref:PEP-CTERM sorting domain-containing protein n=1 Tax=unclassified Microcoleus TaxID=2642155 RepID=UPI001D336234|nr:MULTISPECIES: PEP-CTERM sorting domain-containing protein [unclassified Microcoleus]TAE79486.1 MAG: PEP-CTERM sorting domain-containing protein [Oscillatoriales cyanobacterium]MCC3408241.1 PEP-CTERM sorting domain-containing protein [Microcoleus sp. PH2017_10_PVI_O_A]MCC3462335.1 PEP-CTERM sorting domain-containing protein [Microcoleus sp. PH2017_11_PCY_U_A]MCC3480786.1 PEP-CTERM sorting domain-containing protein [Microcoleus sp. PH2017_12_PCY_D_A]MCC3530713.1 PEP-CTERM sorting domain-conta
MNTKLLSALTATAAATALLGAGSPAQAFSFGTNGITFGQNTDVKFNFKESHGMYTSSLGIYTVNDSVTSLVHTLFSETKSSDNGAENEWKGSLGNTVLGSGAGVFTFLANQVYTLGLNSGSDGTVYSTSALNAGTQQAVFGGSSLWTALGRETTNTFQAAGSYTDGTASLFKGGTVISFDDRGNSNDTDFQDFTVSAEAVPEPITMTGLALGLGGLVAARRRRASKTV